ncbi:hypothetical protein WG66_001905 [Moniliophthora roreri]|nr:hypothetical protein WG66_001905 [Moniliophthora roreri]
MHPIWSRSSSVPRTFSTSEGVRGSRLTGRCVWPFSLSFPCRPIFRSGEVYQLPETFGEEVTIQYELTVDISRGMFRSDDHIRTAFGYVRCSIPEPSSALRQLAYEERIPIPDPGVDVEGWKSLPAIAVHGLIAQSRPAEVQVTLSLAKPLSYTRGSVIPCFLKFSSLDVQALDVARPGDSIKLYLRRTIKYQRPSDSKFNWNEATKDVCTALWWNPPNTSGGTDRAVRYLEGEIQLPKDLKPSAKVEHFSISYTLVLYPIEMTGFRTIGTDLNRPLLSEPVRIVTMYAGGPRPISYLEHLLHMIL